jgi:hypothetical protein
MFRKSLPTIVLGLFSLGGVSCEDPLSFDIRDYTLTLTLQEGYMDEEGVITYPELAAVIEGPGINLWDLTVRSEDGETITFKAHTGTTEDRELPFKAFDKGEEALNISVTARESAHQEFLGQQTLTAKMILLVR